MFLQIKHFISMTVGGAIFTIILWWHGFKNSYKLCMVAHFHSEAILWMKNAFPSDRDGGLFYRDRVGGGGLWWGNLCRFADLIVEGPDCTPRVAGGGLCCLGIELSSSRQEVLHVLVCLRNWIGDLYLQKDKSCEIRNFFSTLIIWIKNSPVLMSHGCLEYLNLRSGCSSSFGKEQTVWEQELYWGYQVQQVWREHLLFWAVLVPGRCWSLPETAYCCWQFVRVFLLSAPKLSVCSPRSFAAAQQSADWTCWGTWLLCGCWS